jgi:hypothetical protein
VGVYTAGLQRILRVKGSSKGGIEWGVEPGEL